MRRISTNRHPRRRFSLAAAIVVVTAGLVAGTPETAAAQVAGQPDRRLGDNHRGELDAGAGGTWGAPAPAPTFTR
ncbi:hypothetical protein [Actinopolymorpha sp. B9G3]|uniref:hypothetical protein n=1 Tax=Actinopolymorpha sp. B9G3 TaxID=3158970 RepID=UPI0032D9335C